MITVEKTISLPDTYPLERLGNLEELLFFDIETTGFSGDYNRLYLIGCTFFRRGSWQLIQWFADRADSEPELLDAFFTFLSRFSALVHFNGDGFDIPFLRKRCRAYGLPYDFSSVKSIDIYKKIRPLRSLLGISSLKQKSIEQFLGIFRQDKYSGGQLIEIYEEYLLTREDRLYDMLMLHNREDLEGMPLILPILNYPDFMESSFRLISQHIIRRTGLSGEQDPYLVLELQSPCRLPTAVSWEGSLCGHPYEAEASGCALTVTLELFFGTLKYFYPDYQNYYYLIYEDTAVHKSVGEFVEKSARKKATAQTCYTKKEGLYLPQAEPLWEPCFKKEYRDKFTYALYEPEMLADSDKRNRYIHSFLPSAAGRPLPGGPT